MSTLTKLALGVMGQLRPRPAQGADVRLLTQTVGWPKR